MSTGPCVCAPSSVCATTSVSVHSSVQCSTARRTTTSYPTVITLSNSDTPTSSTPPQTTCMSNPKILKSKPKRTTCTFCNLVVNKKNIKIHIQRRHSSANTDVTANHHLPSQCIDRNKGIFCCQKKFFWIWKPHTCTEMHLGKQPSSELTSNANGLLNFPEEVA